MRAALARHDFILRSAIDAHGGYVFATGGDGFAATFARAADGLAAASEAQAALGDEPWPAGVTIRVRMGLHTGEAEERGGDYFGPTVNRAARLAAVAHGGQVVCSSVTAGLLPPGTPFLDLGEHRLRDLSVPGRVFQVGEEQFPPLRSLDVLPGNLPSVASSFIGRGAELAELTDELGSARLVTLSGVGGVGKTRLALQVAAEVVAGFAGGAWLCELAVAATPDELAQVVAVALGVVQRPQMTMVESIVDFLRTRATLVVLDNCEHLLDPAADLAQAILDGAPKVRVLATSREALGVAGERVRPIRPLPVGTPSSDAGVSDAVRLFVDRAATADPDLRLDEEGLRAAAEVCRRLDGIPLAIELAAARATTMTPMEIAGHLDERFRLLAGGRRRGVERHQTLRSAIEWSYSLLDETERVVFDRLGVFPASFDEPAAVAVCAVEGVERWDVIDALASLAAKSLVGAERSGGTSRYQLLETLRHFARDQLVARAEIERLRHAHASYYSTIAEEIGSGLVSPDAVVWRPRLALELDNLRAAVGWAFGGPDPDAVRVGVRLLSGLLIYLNFSREWGIHKWSQDALELAPTLDAVDRAVILACAMFNSFYAGDLPNAVRLGQQVLCESDGLSPAVMAAVIIVPFALAQVDAAQSREALAAGRERLARHGGVDWQVAALGTIAAWVAHLLGDQAEARREAEAALAVARKVGWPALLASALTISARTKPEGSADQALAEASEVLRLLDAGAGADAMYGPAGQTLASLLANRGDIASAAEVLASTITRCVDAGDRLTVGPCILRATMVVGSHPGSETTTATLAGTRPALGYPFLSPSDEARYQEVVDRARAVLGPTGFEDAEARGASMAYDEVVLLALEQLHRLAGD
jgi:predicted ATPase